jgi:hypothetical protein
MKNFVFLITILLSNASLSMDKTCPILLESIDSCAEIMWMEGPHLNERGKNKYSSAHIKFFKNGDSSNEAILINDIQVYPWMVMPMMEHGTRPVVLNIMNDKTYMITKILLKKMHGHWEMRFKIGNDSSPKVDYIGKTMIQGTSNGGGHHQH